MKIVIDICQKRDIIIIDDICQNQRRYNRCQEEMEPVLLGPEL